MRQKNLVGTRVSVDKELGEYHLLAHISKNTTNRVYLAHPRVLTQRKVTVKVYQSYRLSNWREVSAFLQKVAQLKRLNHASLLPVLDAGVEQDMPYVVSAYAPNGSLRERLKRAKDQRLPIAEALRLLLQIGQALYYAHERGIVHGNLKPENILFNAENEVRIADFDVMHAGTQTGEDYWQVVRQARYMAPEQFVGIVTDKSDQYALGCLAYELLTGHPPFTALALSTLRARQESGQPVPPKQLVRDLPVQSEQAILKALAKDPDERHADISLFVCMLSNVAESLKVTTPLLRVRAERLAEAPINEREDTLPVPLTAMRARGSRPTFSLRLQGHRVFRETRDALVRGTHHPQFKRHSLAALCCLIVLMTALIGHAFLPMTTNMPDNKHERVSPIVANATPVARVKRAVARETPVAVKATPEATRTVSATATPRSSPTVPVSSPTASSFGPSVSSQMLLIGSVSAPADIVNLTVEGSSDWAHWGLSSSGAVTGFDHKSGVTQQISNYSVFGRGVLRSYSDNPNGYTWSDGTPTSVANDTTTGSAISGLNAGFILTASASTTTHILKVYVGVDHTQGRFVASLSGKGGPVYVDSSLQNMSGTTNGVYTLIYQATAPDQHLTVMFSMMNGTGPLARVTLQAAALQ